MSPIKLLSLPLLAIIILLSPLPSVSGASEPLPQGPIFGFRDSTAENTVESRFLAVPDPKLAEDHLRILTQAPHMAGTPEDKTTADYVANKFREAGLDTEIVEYRVWLNYPAEISVDVTAPDGVTMHGPSRERVDGDPYQDDPRVVMPFNGQSPSGDVEAEVVYANYGTPEDFKKLAQMNVDVHGKIILVRYGQNFRGVKALVAQEHGAAGMLIYSDPYDDGWRKGDKYPKGPWRPDRGVQRGSVGFIFNYPGDPTTPGFASLPTLPDEKRMKPEDAGGMGKIPSIPLSYADASPILEHLAGPESPRDWQGSLPFTYHLGPGLVKVKMHLKQDYQYRTIWNVIGKIRGSEWPDESVVAGNHRDAWVYGAVDPNSGTAAMLESVHGIGELLKSGWKPKRTIVFGSWDAEEEGLVGSTEWAEQHDAELSHAVAYFNMDVGVAGSKFGASSVPTLKQFVRDITKVVASPKGGTVYDAWLKSSQPSSDAPDNTGTNFRAPVAQGRQDAAVGDLGSGSDYTVFLQHLGVPSTDIGSTGNYGVYHSAFDNFNWFKKFGDPNFTYEQQMARVFGLEAIRMADTDILPYDYETYGREIGNYIEAARKKSDNEFGVNALRFEGAVEAAHKFEEAGKKISTHQKKASSDFVRLNQALRAAEAGLLIPSGLPNRPWFRHAIYAPGQYTGYAAVVIPGVNEAIDKHDLERTKQQLELLTSALDKASKVLSDFR